MAGGIDPAWKGVVVDRPATPLKPGEQTAARIAHQFELDWPSGLLLEDHGAGAYLRANDQSPYLDPDEITSAKLAVDGEIEQGAIPQATFPVQKEADLPYLPGLQGALGAYLPASVPRLPVSHGRVIL